MTNINQPERRRASVQLRTGQFIDAVLTASEETRSLVGKPEMRSTRQGWSGEWYIEGIDYRGVNGIEVSLTSDYDAAMSARSVRDRVRAISQWPRTDALTAVAARVSDSAIKRSGIVSVEPDSDAGIILVQSK